MPSIAVDTGPLVALFDRNDAHHARALAYFERATARFVTNLPVITEAVHLLSFSTGAAQDCLGWVTAAFTIDAATVADVPRIVALLDKYSDLPADFADAALVAMCERLGIGAIATFDRDFDVYRLANGKRLRNELRR